MSDATIYNWLKQERGDRGESPGLRGLNPLRGSGASRP
jgi:hypothetical protein